LVQNTSQFATAAKKNSFPFLTIKFIDVISDKCTEGEEEKGIEKRCDNREYIANVDVK
jgi:hypothetical protein